MVFGRLYHLSNLWLFRSKSGIDFTSKCNLLRSLTTSQQNLCDKKLLLKENVGNYVDNHHYNLAAVEALSTYIYVVKPEFPQEIPFSESFSSCHSNWRFMWHMEADKAVDESPSCITISSTTLFDKGYDALERYSKGESLDPQTLPAFKALERFYYNKEAHESCLQHLRMTKKTDTDTVSLLSQHLLSQLLPYPSSYYLDRDSPGRPVGCPCGCGESIQYGLTQLGSPQLFYGTADIVLFPTNNDLFNVDEHDESASAVFTLKKTDVERFGHRDLEEIWNCSGDIENEEIAPGECEVEGLENEDTQRQIYKQAIALSLCKHKRRLNGKFNNSNSDSDVSMVPVCGVTKHTYDVVMYDAENDFLLKMCDDSLKLFDGDSLRFPAVIDLWLLIHHNLFCSKMPQEVLAKLKGTCSLIPQLGEERFASVVENSKWLYQAEPSTVKQTMHPLNQSARHIVDKNVRKYPRSSLF